MAALRRHLFMIRYICATRNNMNISECLSESPVPFAEAIYQISHVLKSYFNGSCSPVPFESTVHQGYGFHLTLIDVLIMAVFFMLSFYIYAAFESAFPIYLLKHFKRLSPKDVEKISVSAEHVFVKLIIVPWCLYVLYHGSSCTMMTMFSVIWKSKEKSQASHLLHLFCLSNYYFKLFSIFFLNAKISRRWVMAAHHVITIILITVSTTHTYVSKLLLTTLCLPNMLYDGC